MKLALVYRGLSVVSHSPDTEASPPTLFGSPGGSAAETQPCHSCRMSPFCCLMLYVNVPWPGPIPVFKRRPLSVS